MIVKEERHHIVVRNKETHAESVAFATRTTQRSSAFGTICTKYGYTTAKYYQVISFSK